MRVAMLTPLQNMDRNYSVCSVIVNQVKMLEAAGHEVVVYAKKGFNRRKSGTLPCMSKVELPAFEVNDKAVASKQMAETFGQGELDGYDAIFTHDLMFLPMLEAWRDGVKLIVAGPNPPKGTWFHWSHSVPRPQKPDAKGLDGHIYVALIEEQRKEVSRMYRVGVERVPVVWNSMDVADLMCTPAARLVRELRLLDTDILGVLPFSTGRMNEKGIQRAVEYYIELSRNFRVKLLLCNARTTDQVRKRTVAQMTRKWRLQAKGLRFQLWWTSEVRPAWADCVPNEVIRDLQQIANLFIYPTTGEGNSLAIAEAMTGSNLCVLPESRVAGMREISDAGAFLCYWQEGHWKEKKFKPPGVVAREIEAFSGGYLGMKVHELRRKWRYSRLRIWEEQMKPMLEQHTGKRW